MIRVQDHPIQHQHIEGHSVQFQVIVFESFGHHGAKFDRETNDRGRVISISDDADTHVVRNLFLFPSNLSSVALVLLPVPAVPGLWSD